MLSTKGVPFRTINTEDANFKEKMMIAAARDLKGEEKDEYKNELRSRMSFVMNRAKQYLHSKGTTQWIVNALASYSNIHTFDRRISTGATDGTKMMFNIPFILSFYQADRPRDKFEDVAAVAFVIAHEILHAKLGHFVRDTSLKDPTDKKARTRMNYAFDHEINCLLAALGLAVPDSLILFHEDYIPMEGMATTGRFLYENPLADIVYKSLRGVPDEMFDDDESRHDEGADDNLDEYDEDVDSDSEDEEKEDEEEKKPEDNKKKKTPPKGKMKPREKKPEEEEGDQTAQGGLGKEAREFKDPIVTDMLDKIERRKQDVIDNMDERMKAEAEALLARQNMIQALKNVHSDYANKLANMLTAQMSQITHASGFWKKTLRMFVRNTNLKDISWSRLSRRFIPYRIYIPKEKDNLLSVSIGFDVSASMHIEDMKGFMLEIEKIMKSFSKNYRIIIHLFSDPVHKEFSTVFDRKNPYSAAAFEVLVKKGQAVASGTQFDDIITTIATDCRDKKYLSLGGIIFTDGDGTAPRYPVPPAKTKIIWCLTSADLTGVLTGIDWGLRILFDSVKRNISN